MITEVIIGVVGTIFILGLAGFSLLFAFVLEPALRDSIMRRRYPLVVPGWKVRLNETPPFKASLEDVQKGLDAFLERCLAVKKYNKGELKAKINNLRIEWIRPQNPEGERYIVDDYGRKIAGDHSGDLIRVVVLPTDTLGSTAFFHELGHEAHEMEAKSDYAHEDAVMWEEIVTWCKKLFK